MYKLRRTGLFKKRYEILYIDIRRYALYNMVNFSNGDTNF